MLYGASSKDQWENHSAELQDFGARLCPVLQIPILLFFFFLINLFIYLFMAVLGLCFCAWAFSSCAERGPLFIAVRGFLTIAASLVAEQTPDAQAQ